MEAVTRSSTRILASNYNGKTLSSSGAPLGKSQINFFRSSTVGFGFSRGESLLISVPLKKTVQCVALSKTEVCNTHYETADAGIQTIQPSKTVHVKFQLQKECLFGEHFFLVGDDPIVGCWDPSNAVPLNWSDGHLWTVELDIPVERTIQFKYVLTGSKGEIFWQPGPDRIFRTWETKSTITITEDWENAEVQKITKEQMTDPTEELMYVLETEPVVHDNVTDLREELMPNVHKNLMSADDDIAYTKDKQTVNRIELITTENETHQKQGTSVNAKKELDREDNIGDNKTKPINRNKWKATMTDKKPTGLEPEEPLLTYEGHVLVPGLNPMPVMSANKAPHREIGMPISADASAKVDADKDQDMPEITC